MSGTSELPSVTLLSDMRIMQPSHENDRTLKGREVRVHSLPRELFVDVHERQAERNHGQTLRRLNERGGIDATEAIAILSCQSWQDMDVVWAHRVLYAWKSSFNRGQRVAEARLAVLRPPSPDGPGNGGA